jgi:hypothetical protein
MRRNVNERKHLRTNGRWLASKAKALNPKGLGARATPGLAVNNYYACSVNFFALFCCAKAEL